MSPGSWPTNTQTTRARSSRATNWACLAESRPRWRIALTVALSPAHEGGRIQPETGEDRAAQDAVCRRRHRRESPSAVHEPIDLAVKHTPDDVFANAVAPVGVQLFSQVVTGAAGRDFGDELGAPSM